jgi:endonuclease/exonuclease/phosphatase family metal-dependent hydrolase
MTELAFTSAPPRPGYAVQPDRSAIFVVDAPNARSVRLAGDFTNWEAGALEMKRREPDGLWSVRTKPLDPGPRFYKHVVDGAWKLDPAHPMMEGDAGNNTNSAMGVGGPSLGGARTLRFASLNLHCWQQPDARLKLEQIAYGLMAMDVHVVALQEVGHHLTDPKQSNAGEILAEQLEKRCPEEYVWHHEWVESHVGFGVYKEGVSLLSRAPLQNFRVVKLGAGPRPRLALLAEVDFGFGRVRVASTHLSWPEGGGDAQAKLLLAELDGTYGAECAATIIGGDFNAEPDSAQIKRFFDAGFADVGEVDEETGGTFGYPPISRIDYQFLRSHSGRAGAGLAATRIFQCKVVGNAYLPRVSDHVGLLGMYSF